MDARWPFIFVYKPFLEEEVVDIKSLSLIFLSYLKCEPPRKSSTSMLLRLSGNSSPFSLLFSFDLWLFEVSGRVWAKILLFSSMPLLFLGSCLLCGL